MRMETLRIMSKSFHAYQPINTPPPHLPYLLPEGVAGEGEHSLQSMEEENGLTVQVGLTLAVVLVQALQMGAISVIS